MRAWQVQRPGWVWLNERTARYSFTGASIARECGYWKGFHHGMPPRRFLSTVTAMKGMERLFGRNPQTAQERVLRVMRRYGRLRRRTLIGRARRTKQAVDRAIRALVDAGMLCRMKPGEYEITPMGMEGP